MTAKGKISIIPSKEAITRTAYSQSRFTSRMVVKIVDIDSSILRNVRVN